MRSKACCSGPSYAFCLSYLLGTFKGYNKQGFVYLLGTSLLGTFKRNEQGLVSLLCAVKDKSCALVWYPFYVKPTRDTPTLEGLFLVLIFDKYQERDTNKASQEVCEGKDKGFA